MQINDIQHFDIVKTYIPANSINTLNMKQNRQPVVKFGRFQDFYVKPHPLINMHDITNKHISAHLRPTSYRFQRLKEVHGYWCTYLSYLDATKL